MADYSGAYSGIYTPPKDAYSAHTRIDALEKRVEQLEKALPEEIIMPNSDLDYSVEINGTKITIPCSAYEKLVTDYNMTREDNGVLRRQLETEKVAARSAKDESARVKKKLREAYDKLSVLRSSLDDDDEEW